MSQNQSLDAKEDKNREIGQYSAEQYASVVIRLMRAREQRHVDERVRLCVHIADSILTHGYLSVKRKEEIESRIARFLSWSLWDFWRGNSYRSIAPSLFGLLIDRVIVRYSPLDSTEYLGGKGWWAVPTLQGLIALLLTFH